LTCHIFPSSVEHYRFKGRIGEAEWKNTSPCREFFQLCLPRFGRDDLRRDFHWLAESDSSGINFIHLGFIPQPVPVGNGCQLSAAVSSVVS
jgi:hypothetical protein